MTSLETERFIRVVVHFLCLLSFTLSNLSVLSQGITSFHIVVFANIAGRLDYVVVIMILLGWSISYWSHHRPIGPYIPHETIRCNDLAFLIEDKSCEAWWRYQLETFSALLAICAVNSPVTGELPAQRPVTRRFDIFFDLRLYIRLSKQSWGCWFDTPSRPLPRHCNGKGAHGLKLLLDSSDCFNIALIVCQCNYGPIDFCNRNPGAII